MATVMEGATLGFVVQGFNKKGNPVPLTDASVSTGDASIATATVNADGTGGVLTGVNGEPTPGNDTTLNALAAGKTDSQPVTVTPDVVVDNIKIVFGA